MRNNRYRSIKGDFCKERQRQIVEEIVEGTKTVSAPSAITGTVS